MYICMSINIIRFLIWEYNIKFKKGYATLLSNYNSRNLKNWLLKVMIILLENIYANWLIIWKSYHLFYIFIEIKKNKTNTLINLLLKTWNKTVLETFKYKHFILL